MERNLAGPKKSPNPADPHLPPVPRVKNRTRIVLPPLRNPLPKGAAKTLKRSPTKNPHPVGNPNPLPPKKLSRGAEAAIPLHHFHLRRLVKSRKSASKKLLLHFREIAVLLIRTNPPAPKRTR